ncbi:exodeoxyribonuclease VII small subunit [Candidatus Fermentibacterales bacterium]|nr:exodeoxyribonuclease VII small subunit [Candidatus Fermentibacterales bacterium]
MSDARAREKSGAATSKRKAGAAPSFEEALGELTAIVEKIGSEDCPVDSLEEMVRRAADLIRTLRGRLQRTEGIVTEILEELQRPEESEQGKA